MFYTYVSQLPMVADNNLTLSKGTRLEFEAGSLRKAKADQYGFRCFVFYDKARDVTYRVTGKGLQVDYGESAGYKKLFIKTQPGILKHTAFAVEGEAAEVNSFVVLTEKMMEEYIQRKSMWSRAKVVFNDPLGKIFICAAAIYAIATIAVLYFG